MLYWFASSIRKESFIYSKYFSIVFVVIDLFFKDLNVLLNFTGLVREPIDEERIFKSSFISELFFLILYLFLMSLIYVSSKILLRYAIFCSSVGRIQTNGSPPPKKKPYILEVPHFFRPWNWT